MPESLTTRTLRGLKWSYISTFTTALLQLGYAAVMARLLNPSDFGLVAMGGVVLRFGNYFAQMGMGPAIVQKKEITEQQIRAAFTSSVFLGLGFSALAFLLAPLTMYVFDNQGVVPLVRVMGLSFLLNGFSLTPLALIRRELRFKALAGAEITSFVIGYPVVGISSAILGFGVWSLVFASLTQSALMALQAFFISRRRLSMSFSWAHYKPLFSFGSKVSVISFFEFIGGSLDTLVIGRYFGSSPLGIYNRAQMLTSLPMQYFTSSFSRVIFPSISQIQDDNERIKNNIFLVLQVVSIVIFPFAILAVVLSKEIVAIMLGPKWIEASLLLKFLAFAAAVDLQTHFIAALFEAKGLLRQKLTVQTTFVGVLSVAFYVGLGNGVQGIALAVVTCHIARFVHYVFYFLKEFRIGAREMLKPFVVPVFTCAANCLFLISFYQYVQRFSPHNYVTAAMTLVLFLIVNIGIFCTPANMKLRNELYYRLKSLNA